MNSYSLDELSQYFHLPINDVAKELGVCATVLKKICRKNGIKRWPHRKIKSLARMIETLQAIVPSSPADAAALREEIEALESKKAFLLRNPNVSYKSVVPKYCISACQSRLQKAQSTGAISSLHPNVRSSNATPTSLEKETATSSSAAANTGRKRTRTQAFSSTLHRDDYEYDFDSQSDYEEDSEDDDYGKTSTVRSSSVDIHSKRPSQVRKTTIGGSSTTFGRPSLHDDGVVPKTLSSLTGTTVAAAATAASSSTPSISSTTSSITGDVEEDAAEILLAFSQPDEIFPVKRKHQPKNQQPHRSLWNNSSSSSSSSSSHHTPIGGDSSKQSARSQLYSSSEAVACMNSLPTLQLKPPTRSSWLATSSSISATPTGTTTTTTTAEDYVPVAPSRQVKRQKISHDSPQDYTQPHKFVPLPPLSMLFSAELPQQSSSTTPSTITYRKPQLPPLNESFVGVQRANNHSVPTLYSSPFSSPVSSPPPSPSRSSTTSVSSTGITSSLPSTPMRQVPQFLLPPQPQMPLAQLEAASFYHAPATLPSFAALANPRSVLSSSSSKTIPMVVTSQ